MRAGSALRFATSERNLRMSLALGHLLSVTCGEDVARVGSMWTPFFTDRPVDNWSDATTSDKARFGRFFHEMLRRDVSLAPSQFEANFLSIAHTDADIDAIVAAAGESLALAWG
ncbi:MAG: hypothetical protein AB1806_21720 [Acidobacteriota bacterium]